MKEIDISYRTMFAELAQRTLDAQFTADFPLEGWFVTVTVKNRDYWYFDLPTPEGKDKRSYVGPHSDEEITARVKAHKEIKDNIRERRRMVSTLRRAGLPGPDPFAGDVTRAPAVDRRGSIAHSIATCQNLQSEAIEIIGMSHFEIECTNTLIKIT